MRLLIDGTQGKVSKISLFEKEKLIEEIQTENILKTVDELLKKRGLELKDLEKIEAAPGPGSYTGLKVSYSIVSALNFSLGRKVFSLPEY